MESWITLKCTVQPEFGDMTGYRLLQPGETISKDDEYFETNWAVYRDTVQWNKTGMFSERMGENCCPHRRKLVAEDEWEQGELLFDKSDSTIVEYVITYKDWLIIIDDDGSPMNDDIKNKDNYVKLDSIQKINMPSGQYYIYEYKGEVKVKSVED